MRVPDRELLEGRWRGRLAAAGEVKLEEAVVADEVSWKVIDAGNENKTN
jgi:hypothetical protein